MSVGAVKLDRERAGIFRALARPAALRASMQAPARQLADDLVEGAYEAELGGNPKRARYLLGWSTRAERVAAEVVSP